MRKLTKFIAPAIIAASVLGGAASAQAQPYPQERYGHHDDGYGRATPARAETIRSQIDDLQRRVERNDNRDRISEREARGLRQDVWQLRQQFRSFNRDGLNDREFRILQNRIDNVRARLHIERNDRDGHRW